MPKLPALPRIPPPLLAAFLALAMWLLADFGNRLPLSNNQTLIMVSVLVATGILVEILATFKFTKVKTTINPISPEKSSSLVTTGVYGYTRNPMYLSAILLILAWAIYLGAAISIFAPIIFFAYINAFQIPAEERALSKHFGAAYLKYCASVRRWI